MDKETLGKRLQDFFRKEIPITRSMGFSVLGWDGKNLVVSGRVSKNLNHKKNAFGGSIYSLATVAGWGMARLLSEEAGMLCHVVIQEGSMSYLKPLSKDFRARCARPDAKVVEAFIASLKRKGKARLAVTCEITEAVGSKDLPSEDKGPAGLFKGVLVATHTLAAKDDDDDGDEADDSDED
jgi:thioesterase domain-containing protein